MSEAYSWIIASAWRSGLLTVRAGETDGEHGLFFRQAHGVVAAVAGDAGGHRPWAPGGQG